jgi:hypothetical protein
LNHRIVEIQGLSFSKGTQKLIDTGITSIDTNGNIYIAVVNSDYSIANTDISGRHTIERVILADGSSPYGLTRNTVKHKTDSKKDYQAILLGRADKKDWQGFETSITHEDGYYLYGGKYHSSYDKPPFRSFLTIKYRGGVESCAFGSVDTDGAYAQFPADNKGYYSCFNY